MHAVLVDVANHGRNVCGCMHGSRGGRDPPCERRDRPAAAGPGTAPEPRRADNRPNDIATLRAQDALTAGRGRRRMPGAPGNERPSIAAKTPHNMSMGAVPACAASAFSSDLECLQNLGHEQPSYGCCEGCPCQQAQEKPARGKGGWHLQPGSPASGLGSFVRSMAEPWNRHFGALPWGSGETEWFSNMVCQGRAARF